MNVTKTEMDAAESGMTMEDCDEDVWAKRPNGTWSILDYKGDPQPLSHSSAYLAEHFGPFVVIGVSQRLQELFKDDPVPAKPTDPLEVEEVNLVPEDVGKYVRISGQENHLEDAKLLHELVQEGRYYIRNNHAENPNIFYGCNEHKECWEGFAEPGTGASIDPIVLLKWIEKHEEEQHSK